MASDFTWETAGGRATRRGLQTGNEGQLASALAAPTSLLLLIWWVFGQVQFLNLGGATPDANGSITATQEGSVINTLVVVAFGTLGAVQLRRCSRVLALPRVRLVLVGLAAYVVWAAATLLWSIDTTLTVRRCVQLVFVIVGSVGLGLGFYGMSKDGHRALAIHTVVAGLVAMLVLWISVGRSGEVNIFDPSFAAKNISNGTQAILYPLAFSIGALIWLWQRRSIRPWLAALYVAIWLISVFVIKGRFITSFALLMACVQGLLEPRLSLKKGAACVALAAIVSYGLGVVVALGGLPLVTSIQDSLFTYATLDTGGNDITTLTGRTLLWDELLRYAQDRPWSGYGFGAFWNPDIMPQIWRVIGWRAPAGHEGYLDEVLGTGIIGLGLMLSVWLAGIVLALRARLQQVDLFGGVVLAWMALFLLFNLGDSILQTYFQFPFYASLIALFAVLGQQNSPVGGHGAEYPRSPSVASKVLTRLSQVPTSRSRV